MDSLRLKIPPFEKARTVLEALKQQEQERRKKVGNRWEQAVLSQLGIALVCQAQSWEPLAFCAGSQTELRNITEGFGLSSVAEKGLRLLLDPGSAGCETLVLLCAQQGAKLCFSSADMAKGSGWFQCTVGSPL